MKKQTKDKAPKKAVVRVLVVDPLNKIVEERMIDNKLEALQAIVDGYIEAATTLPTGEVIFVNDAGGFREDWREARAAFRLESGLALVGPAVVVRHNLAGEMIDCKIKREDLAVQFAR